MLEGDTKQSLLTTLMSFRRAIAPADAGQRGSARPDYDGVQLRDGLRRKEVSVSLVRQEQHHLNAVSSAMACFRAYRSVRLPSLARNDRLLSESALTRIDIERKHQWRKLWSYDGQITDPDLLALIERDLVLKPFIAPAPGTFGQCAYRFFAQRVLEARTTRRGWRSISRRWTPANSARHSAALL